MSTDSRSVHKSSSDPNNQTFKSVKGGPFDYYEWLDSNYSVDEKNSAGKIEKISKKGRKNIEDDGNFSRDLLESCSEKGVNIEGGQIGMDTEINQLVKQFEQYTPENQRKSIFKKIDKTNLCDLKNSPIFKQNSPKQVKKASMQLSENRKQLANINAPQTQNQNPPSRLNQTELFEAKFRDPSKNGRIVFDETILEEERSEINSTKGRRQQRGGVTKIKLIPF